MDIYFTKAKHDQNTGTFNYFLGRMAPSPLNMIKVKCLNIRFVNLATRDGASIMAMRYCMSKKYFPILYK